MSRGVIGSTTDSGSVSLGSSPSGTARQFSGTFITSANVAFSAIRKRCAVFGASHCGWLDPPFVPSQSPVLDCLCVVIRRHREIVLVGNVARVPQPFADKPSKCGTSAPAQSADWMFGSKGFGQIPTPARRNKDLAQHASCFHLFGEPEICFFSDCVT